MHGHKLIGVLFFALATGCLVLTGWIIHKSGLTQGATEDGQWALGWAAIAVHLSLAVCGLAMFVSRKFIVSLVCGIMMLGAAVCSAWQIASFLAVEVISVTKAREAADKRATDRNTAALEAAKARQQTQAKLAEQQLKWFQSTAREADGRRERREMVEAGGKLIAEIGKVDAPAPVAPEAVSSVPLKTDVLAEWLASRFGWDRTTLQISPSLSNTLMLLLGELVFWPLASFFWNRQAAIEIGPVAAPAAEPAPPLPTAAQPAALAVAEPPKALPAPTTQSEPPPTPSNPPQPQRPRQPIPHSVQVLVDMGYPLTRPTGGLRPKEPPKDAARRFITWARAMGLDGTYSATELSTLYREFAEADHREPVAYNQLASALGTTRAIERKRPKDATTSVWIITPGRFKPKVQAAPAAAATEDAEVPTEDSAPDKEGGVVTRPPFGVARVVVSMRPDGSDLAWLRRQQKSHRAMRIARNRKQRGSFITRAA